jgi:kynurenine formamidase
MLLETTTASGIAVDTLSLDFGPSPDFATHNAWLPSGRWGLEAVANLARHEVILRIIHSACCPPSPPTRSKRMTTVNG